MLFLVSCLRKKSKIFQCSMFCKVLPIEHSYFTEFANICAYMNIYAYLILEQILVNLSFMGHFNISYYKYYSLLHHFTRLVLWLIQDLFLKTEWLFVNLIFHFPGRSSNIMVRINFMHPLNICVSFLKKGIFLPLHQYEKYSVEWKLKKKNSKNTPKQNKYTKNKICLQSRMWDSFCLLLLGVKII